VASKAQGTKENCLVYITI